MSNKPTSFNSTFNLFGRILHYQVGVLCCLRGNELVRIFKPMASFCKSLGVTLYLIVKFEYFINIRNGASIEQQGVERDVVVVEHL